MRTLALAVFVLVLTAHAGRSDDLRPAAEAEWASRAAQETAFGILITAKPHETAKERARRFVSTITRRAGANGSPSPHHRDAIVLIEEYADAANPCLPAQEAHLPLYQLDETRTYFVARVVSPADAKDGRLCILLAEDLQVISVSFGTDG